PGLDGSAHLFVAALLQAGIVRQEASRPIYCVDRSVIVSVGSATLALHPPSDDPQMPGLFATYFLDYGPHAPIARQVHTQTLTPGGFARHLAPCRTFILESEAQELRRQGVGARTTPADLLVFGPRGPIANRLRFANEPARHKILDMVGD